MKLTTYVLMQVAPGRAKEAAEAISKINGIKMAHAVTGPFDVIAYAEVNDLSTLSDLILAKIQNVEGVQKTQTAVVVTPEAISQTGTKTRTYKTPTPPKEWVEETVRELVKSDPEIAHNPIEVLKRVRDEARKNNYRPIIAPAQVQALLNRVSQ
jgi:uncharacterized protein with GYD domain